jgi:hypothetical protein
MNHPLAYSVNWEALDDELDSLHPSHGSIFHDEYGDCWRDIYHPADFNQYQRAESSVIPPTTYLTRDEILEQLMSRPISDSQAFPMLPLRLLLEE